MKDIATFVGEAGKIVRERTHGEPKGEVSVGVVRFDMRKQVEFTHEPKGTEARLWQTEACHNEWTHGLPAYRGLLNVLQLSRV